MGNALEDVLAQAGANADDVAAQAAPIAETAETAPARDASGRFASRAAETDTHTPADDASTAAPPASSAPAEPGHVPLGVMLDEREKRQAAEKALKELQSNLERQRAEWQASQPAPTSEEAAQAQRYADNLRYSRKFAERAHGADTVAQLHDWAVARCDADPFFNEQMRSSDDPYEAAMTAWRREQIADQVSPADLEEFNAWKATKAAAQANPQPAPAAQPAPPPRSLANVSGSGAMGADAIPVGPGQAFEGLFRK